MKRAPGRPSRGATPGSVGIVLATATAIRSSAAKVADCIGRRTAGAAAAKASTKPA